MRTRRLKAPAPRRRRAAGHADLFDVPLVNVQPEGWRPSAPPELRGERIICLDAETDGLEWWNGARPVGWSYFLPASGRRGYLPMRHKGGGNLDTAVVQEWMRRELRGVHIENINTKFDLHIARADGTDLINGTGNTFGDVAHRAALLDDHRFRFNLDQLAEDFLGPDRGKVDLKLTDKGRLHELPAWAVEEYAIQDTVLVGELMDAMQPELEAQELLRVLDLEQQIIPVVVEMESNGAYLDVDLLDRWTREAREEYEEILWKVFKATGIRVESVDSNKTLEAVFKARGIPITTFTDSGKPSFTQDVMQRVAVHDSVIADLLYAGQLKDLDSKYLGKYSNTVRRSDGWIRFNLHQLRVGRDENDKYGTVSGRFSSAGDEHGGFNVQQVVSPKKQADKKWCQKYVVRNLFKPRNGVWLAVDASQIEYRIFAHFANSAEILAAYAPVPGMSVEEMMARKVGPFTDYHDKVQEILVRAKPDIKRKHTKITNFCKLFGSAEIKFAYTLEMIGDKEFKELNERYAAGRWQNRMGERARAIRSEPCLKEALEVYDTYDRMFPDAKATFDLAKSTAKERGWVRTIMGRRARFPKAQRVHSALNRIVQGTAADINKRVLVEVYNRREELGLTLRMTVHDEVDADLADEAMLPRVEEVFNTQYIPLKVPILWEAETGPSWGEAKKKA